MRAALRRDRTAATSLEFAMAGLTLMVLLLAVFDIGLLFLAKRGLDHGLARSARWAAVNSGTATVATVLNQFKLAAGGSIQDVASCQGYAAGATIPASVLCAVTVGFPSGTAAGNPVTVQASYRWSPVSPIDGLAVVQLQSSTALTIQH